MRIAKYLKRAFLNQWNLLAFVGASAFGLLSGRPDIVLPVVAAGELAYLGMLGTHPKFQAYVEAQEAKAARGENSGDTQRTLERITQSLPRAALDRFLELRTRCLELQQIAVELKHPGQETAELPFENFQADGLDRLLWIHLRLLYTQNALERFLKKTSEQQIRDDIRRLEDRLATLSAEQPGGTANTGSTQAQKIRKALEDNLATSRDRLLNLQKARDNYELVKLEIERLENKTRSLAELAVNRQEPDFISGQVDQVAASMLETEKTMNDLQFVTGLETLEETPEMLRVPVAQRQ